MAFLSALGGVAVLTDGRHGGRSFSAAAAVVLRLLWPCDDEGRLFIGEKKKKIG